MFKVALAQKPKVLSKWQNEFIVWASGKCLYMQQIDETGEFGEIAQLENEQSQLFDINCVKCISADVIAIGNLKGRLQIFRLNLKLHHLSLLLDHVVQNDFPVVDLAYSNRYLVVSSIGGQIQILTLNENSDQLANLQEINLPKGNVALSLCIGIFTMKDQDGNDRAVSLLACGSTDSKIYVYANVNQQLHELQMTLEGHTDWVKCLQFSSQMLQFGCGAVAGDLLLASGSQDKHIRLWRFSQLQSQKQQGEADVESELQTRIKTIKVDGAGLCISVQLDAVLAGHEDWVHSVEWCVPTTANQSSDASRVLELLSASADKSIIRWQQEWDTSSDVVDDQSGVYMEVEQAQSRGSGMVWCANDKFYDLSVTSDGLAAGASSSFSSSCGGSGGVGSSGFYAAFMWCDKVNKLGVIVGHAFAGTLQIWRQTQDYSFQCATTQTGHSDAAKSVCWDDSGRFLLSCGLDKSTRLWTSAAYQDVAYNTKPRWIELCRPQIHGYPLLKAQFLTADGQWFISCAEGEKVLRVFHASSLCQELLLRSQNIAIGSGYGNHDEIWQNDGGASTLPALGLSNKSAESGSCRSRWANMAAVESLPAVVPLENHLSSVTLWDESDKLYAHGDDIHTLQVSHDKRCVISANVSRASYNDIAQKEGTLRSWSVIGQESTNGNNHDSATLNIGIAVRKNQVWNTHTQTITAISFSQCDNYFLTVGRDRQWTLMKRNVDGNYDVHLIKKAAHSRIIWDAAWAYNGSFFATGSRDASLKFWSLAGTCLHTAKMQHAITAIASYSTQFNDNHVFAVGFESGLVELLIGSAPNSEWQSVKVPTTSCSTSSVSSLSWNNKMQLAISWVDGSVRVLNNLLPA